MIEKNLNIRIKTSIILFLLVIFMIKFNIFSIYILIVFAVLSILEFFQISIRISKSFFLRYFYNLIFVLYISLYIYTFFIFINFPHLKTILYIFLFGCVASDVGGYLFGKIFKGPKLSKISPNKTFSGSIGSIIFTCLTISLLLFVFTNNFSYSILIIGVFTSISCQLGDLFFSLLKRKAKIKDTGKFLPGHGGILDRIDGILIGMPMGFIFLLILS